MFSLSVSSVKHSPSAGVIFGAPDTDEATSKSSSASSMELWSSVSGSHTDSENSRWRASSLDRHKASRGGCDSADAAPSQPCHQPAKKPLHRRRLEELYNTGNPALGECNGQRLNGDTSVENGHVEVIGTQSFHPKLPAKKTEKSHKNTTSRDKPKQHLGSIVVNGKGSDSENWKLSLNESCSIIPKHKKKALPSRKFSMQ